MAQPVTPSTQPSTHQPSRTLRLGTPFSAAFMPLVPEASCGTLRRIQPEIDAGSDQLGERHVVVLEVDDFDIVVQSGGGLNHALDQGFAAAIVRMGFAGIQQSESVRRIWAMDFRRSMSLKSRSARL